MMRTRIALVAVLASAAVGLSTAGTAVASNGTTVPPKVTSLPPIDSVHVAGIATNGKHFKGTYGIERFVAGANKVYAIGTLTGTLGHRPVSLYGVRMPASLTGSSPLAMTRRAQKAQASCSILHLVLGPINLNLLGLRVKLGGGTGANLPITLDITAVPGTGNLLGNLLCDLTGALDQTGILGQLSGQLSQLSTTLNGLLSLLGGL
jgi:hypothetical protein